MSDPVELSPRQRRTALEALPRERLSRVTEHFDLNVADRRVAASHVDAIVRAKHVDFAEVLDQLARDELKAVCEALGLDTSGREKQALIDRILGTANAAGASGNDKAASGSRKSSGQGASGGAEILRSPDPNAKLTRQQLENYLWAAADILPGSIDSSDYKNFIFGLLFLKRLSDRFDEECEQLVAEGIDPEQHDEHRVFVPKRARWSEIQKHATGLGELNRASSNGTRLAVHR
jgi:type I restriction enzyme M protein